MKKKKCKITSNLDGNTYNLETMFEIIRDRGSDADETFELMNNFFKDDPAIEAKLEKLKQYLAEKYPEKYAYIDDDGTEHDYETTAKKRGTSRHKPLSSYRMMVIMMFLAAMFIWSLILFSSDDKTKENPNIPEISDKLEPL